MTRSLFNPLFWPIRFRIVAAALLVLVLIYIPAFFIQRQRMLETTVANARTYITEIGTQQSAALTAALDISLRAIDDFSSDHSVQTVLHGLLVGPINSNINLNLPDVTVAAVEVLLQNRLLNIAATPYENIRVLDAQGQVRARVQVGGRVGGGVTDESDSPAFTAIRSAELRGLDRTLNVTVDNFPQLDYVVAIRWRDGHTIGYLATRLSNARVLFANLRAEDTVLPAYSMLVTPANEIIVPVDTFQNYAVSINEAIIERAADGETGVERYVTTTGVDVVGYFTPISDTNLVLVAQALVQPSFVRVQQQQLAPALALLIGGFILMLVITMLLGQTIVPPLRRLRRAAQKMAEGEFATAFPDAKRGDELGELAATLETVRDTFRTRVGDLENRVTSRGRDIAATQEISRYAATQRDLQLLMDRVVELIIERFPALYHAQIFLVDEDGRYAVVRASTGEVGKQLIARGHRLAVGSISVIGQVTDQARTIITRDISASQVHRRNEFLPDTRAELAVPLAIGDRVIGALDVQSKARDAFSDDLVTVLQTMADQLAIAIENARLYEESLRRVADIEAVNRRATLAAWQDYMRVLRASGVSRDAGIPDTIGSDAISALRAEAIRTGELAIGQPTARATIPVALPITLRGQALGAVEWELPMQSFTDDKLELALELANRLAVSMDNARLFQESQRSAERERLVNSIAARLTAQTSIDTILQTAVREVGQALRVPNVSIRLRSLGTSAEGVETTGPAAGSANGSASCHPNGSSNDRPAGGNGNGSHSPRPSAD